MVVALNVVYFEIIDSHVTTPLLYSVKVALEQYNILLGMEELKLVNAIVIFIGLISQPKVASFRRPSSSGSEPEFAVPRPQFKSTGTFSAATPMSNSSTSPTKPKFEKSPSKKAAPVSIPEPEEKESKPSPRSTRSRRSSRRKVD